MRDFAYSWITEQPFVHREANHTETSFSACFSFFAPEYVLIIMFLAFVLYTPRCVTWPLAHEANLCKFSTSCTDLSWKRPVLCIMQTRLWVQLASGNASLFRTGCPNRYRKFTENVIFGCFWCSFDQERMVEKRRHYSAGKTRQIARPRCYLKLYVH